MENITLRLALPQIQRHIWLSLRGLQKESFTEVDDFVNATAGEFLNVNDGLFVVNESNEHGVELTLTPQEFFWKMVSLPCQALHSVSL